jgi:hypothetical protein
MVWFRKAMILTHRYLGIALCVPIVMWFVSGIGMMYAGGMPRLTPETRLERLPPLDLTRVRLSPAEAAEHGNMTTRPGRLVLTTVLNRPAYRFDRGSFSVVFADTGDLMSDVGAAEAMTIASRFTHLPEESLHPAGVVTEPDQWTIGQADQMPLHKFTVDDAAATEVYVSAPLGEVSVHTTRGTRALAWVAAIPHWLFLVELRRHGELWRQLVLWTSGLATLSALIGLVLAVTQFSPSSPFRFNRLGASIPYVGLMRWHYITGAIFGIFTVTWLFSGMMSLEPWGWASGGGSGRGVRSALAGGELDVARFPRVDAAAWEEALPGRVPKEMDLLLIQGEPYYSARGVESKPVMVAANPLRIRREPFSIESVMDRVKQGNPGVPIVESQVLPDFDSYYYERGQAATLPVLRVKFGDPDRTWFYIDPATSRVVEQLTWRARLNRWVFFGLHTLDFSFWYYTPLWDIGVIALSIGGGASAAIGMFIGFRRLKRNARRIARPAIRT